MREAFTKWRSQNREKHLALTNEWRQKNKAHINNYAKTYCAQKLATDENFKLKVYLRSRASRAIKRGQKAGSFVRDLGCSIEDLKSHIERQFKDGMMWSNWGKIWQLDHIRPLASFDLTDRDQFLVACNYKNLTTT